MPQCERFCRSQRTPGIKSAQIMMAYDTVLCSTTRNADSPNLPLLHPLPLSRSLHCSTRYLPHLCPSGTFSFSSFTPFPLMLFSLLYALLHHPCPALSGSAPLFAPTRMYQFSSSHRHLLAFTRGLDPDGTCSVIVGYPSARIPPKKWCGCLLGGGHCARILQ